jgi:hypothetical protein
LLHISLVQPSSVPAQARTSTVARPPAQHHTNPVLFGVALVLLLAAIILFWLAKRSVKSTT